MEYTNEEMAYAEIYELLELLGEEYKNMIPKEVYENIINQMPKQYDQDQIQIKVAKDDLSDEALKIFAVLNTEYFTEDETLKKIYKAIYEANEEEYKMQHENPELKNITTDVFESRKAAKKQVEIEEIEEKDVDKEMINYEKTNIFKKIINKIKSIFKK